MTNWVLRALSRSGAICPIARVLGASNAMRREQAVLAHHPSHTGEANQSGRAKVLQKPDTPLDGSLTVAHAV